eukprot:TRINITY_DN609_c0_g1_i1.p1 TRINITY_DN609_c0_g1~~TRINITY_DN609_c0_g1_i1.p1  ORF type:complete len:139 (-),score=31.47 TRINITY_DN609_c0_g1_i1:76-492(-)
MSGVTVADSVVEKYNEIKMKKTLRFVTFKIENKKTIVPADEGEMDKTWDDFVAVLPEEEPRYCLVEVEYESEDGRPQNKLTFVFWSNDEKVSIKNKMLYASSKDAIKKKFQGIMKEVQANDYGDLDFDSVILQKMRAK